MTVSWRLTQAEVLETRNRLHIYRRAYSLGAAPDTNRSAGLHSNHEVPVGPTVQEGRQGFM